ncbi:MULTISPECIES: M48 family metallopeptidase [Paraburkholderia]|jgi:STE24 endopeptidase|uniref:M48 family metallopeptidase n=1 Tax=Paraburkholderia madseniana TaxID=2599607 RepID=A0AAP5BD68_9BURK|nr:MULTISPECIES: M48 family metallopeptidase [Paraburkholderia]MCX4146559.1 M48 family metallopeptidase [Paraburkholderia madseniana]MCX4173246.1 M48 family metallopeptidase [Paraburkholderia madseniana]MDN7149505.1 M48 family metallopeptidase [Paraburkholderia sp. WS6]MDQ6408385.1 M48 family metallopeptidase [Paraburkholderia madseniana]MDQ6461251.1 M48 family metallopeptidase [Paraburkholderia madseniana]
MPTLYFTVLFVVAVVAMVGTKLWLASRQIRFVAGHREQVPSQFAGTIALTAHQRAADYTVERTRLTMIEIVVGAAVLIGLTLLGGVQALDLAISDWLGRGYAGQIALVAAVIAITSVIDLPFEYYRQFVVEQRFGFNRMSKGIFFLDRLKGVLLGAAFGLPLLFVVLWLMNQAGSLWWLWTWIVWVAFQLLVLVLYPSFIAPLFNKFEPLKDEALKSRIEALMQRCGFAAKGLFVMDGSRRSAHGNAYFTGFGAAKRIVFFDTLLARLSGNEIEAVLAHELGHFKRRHVIKRMVVMFAISLVMLALLGWLTQCVWFYEGLGVRPSLIGGNSGLALVLFFLALPVFLFFVTPLGSLSSRKHEFEADAFAATQTDAQDLVNALVKLYEDNASTLTPDPLYTAFYYSHPPASQRIDRLLRHA